MVGKAGGLPVGRQIGDILRDDMQEKVGGRIPRRATFPQINQLLVPPIQVKNRPQIRRVVPQGGVGQPQGFGIYRRVESRFPTIGLPGADGGDGIFRQGDGGEAFAVKRPAPAGKGKIPIGIAVPLPFRRQIGGVPGDDMQEKRGRRIGRRAGFPAVSQLIVMDIEVKGGAGVRRAGGQGGVRGPQ